MKKFKCFISARISQDSPEVSSQRARLLMSISAEVLRYLYIFYFSLLTNKNACQKCLTVGEFSALQLAGPID